MIQYTNILSWDHLQLREALRLCTTESPFFAPSGELFLQIDGIATGSPLGPIFTEFYTNNIEQRLSHLISSKTLIYCRYVDDIFIMTHEEEDADCLIQAFEDKSVLKFTHECSDKDGSLPFLDVLVKPFDDKLLMKVHVTNAH